MSRATLLLRLTGPMQSWGSRSRFGNRDTERTPTKSGVCGLLAAAQGRPRSADLSDLAAMEMAVRVDQPGHVESDYQTVGGGTFRGEPYGVAKASGARGETLLSQRFYLADAAFLVALTGAIELCEDLQAALASPRWPLFLGRRGYVPGLPVHFPDGVVTAPAVQALQKHHWPTGRNGAPAPELTAEVECAHGVEGDLRRDVPLSFASHDRRYGDRMVRRITLTHDGAEPCS